MDQLIKGYAGDPTGVMVSCADRFCGPSEERMFLVAVDAHSKWPEVAIMRSTTREKTTKKLGEMFSCFKSPEQLVSDRVIPMFPTLYVTNPPQTFKLAE